MSVKYANAVLTCLVNGNKPGKTMDSLCEEFHDGSFEVIEGDTGRV